jgi:hypothetical protein
MAKIPNCKSYDEGQCTAGTTGDNPNCEGIRHKKTNRDREFNWLWTLALIPCLVAFTLLWSEASHSVQDYKYSAEVHMPKSSEGIMTQVYFNEYIQNKNQVTIEKFVTIEHTHWTDFDNKEQSLKPVIITLIDNNGNFIYTDRVNKVTLNDNIVATQP